MKVPCACYCNNITVAVEGGRNSVHRWLLGRSCFRIWKCESLGLYSVFHFPIVQTVHEIFECCPWLCYRLSCGSKTTTYPQGGAVGDQWFFLWSSVSCWAVSIPDCDTVCQDAFYFAVVQKPQQSSREVGLHQGSEEVKSLLGFFDYSSRADRPFEMLIDMKAQELKAGHSISSLPIISDSLVSP